MMMTSVKLKFSPPSVLHEESFLYFQLIHRRVVKLIRTNYRIYPAEWDAVRNEMVSVSPISKERDEILQKIKNKISWETHCLMKIIEKMGENKDNYSLKDVVAAYKGRFGDKVTVFGYINRQIDRQKAVGRDRTSETYRQMLNSFMKYRDGVDLSFDMFDDYVVEQYEMYLRKRNLCRNSTSFYMRILRSVYNKAVNDGHAVQTNPFKYVYTGVDKTSKRAISSKDIKNIKDLDLRNCQTIEFARDIFLFSFYTRGMSFIDIAYLRKKDIINGFLVYNRKKTGQQIVIRWEKQMQDIINKYSQSESLYLLPIIVHEGSSARNQYLNKLLFVNRKLKQVAKMAQIKIPLSMYVARHSWACVAQEKNIPVSIISEGMGHDNEETTKIYLSSIKTNQIDEANRKILKDF